MEDCILRLRELNRATLARQMLLERETLAVPAAIERLAGLQAQLASAPYVGLWTRLRDFRREDLAGEIENRKVVKATMMRATLHLCTADDYARFRTALKPVLIGASSAIAKQRGQDFDLDKVLKAARKFIGEKPRTFAEISDMLTELMPDHDVGVMRYSVRTYIPLVQVPINAEWSYSNKPEFTLAESWIGRPISTKNATPEKARASNTAVVSLEFLMATALGICTSRTHRNIIKPERPPASRDVIGTMIPTPPAIRAAPAKYVQKTPPGIHEGTILVTIST
jgi:hypothetical protein